MTDTPPDPDRLELRSALVGRDDEMAALRRALDRTDQGQGGALERARRSSYSGRKSR